MYSLAKWTGNIYKSQFYQLPDSTYEKFQGENEEKVEGQIKYIVLHVLRWSKYLPNCLTPLIQIRFSPLMTVVMTSSQSCSWIATDLCSILFFFKPNRELNGARVQILVVFSLQHRGGFSYTVPWTCGIFLLVRLYVYIIQSFSIAKRIFDYKDY